jgi:hypothetical protein
MRPVAYNDAQPTDSAREEVPLEGDTDEVTMMPREKGDRASVKPQNGSLDDSPMRYTPWNRVDNVFGLDDDDEQPEEAEYDELPVY